MVAKLKTILANVVPKESPLRGPVSSYWQATQLPKTGLLQAQGQNVSSLHREKPWGFNKLQPRSSRLERLEQVGANFFPVAYFRRGRIPPKDSG